MGEELICNFTTESQGSFLNMNKASQYPGADSVSFNDETSKNSVIKGIDDIGNLSEFINEDSKLLNSTEIRPIEKIIDKNGVNLVQQSTKIFKENQIYNILGKSVANDEEFNESFQSLLNAKKMFFNIFDILTDQGYRHDFICWLDKKINEAKLMGRMIVEYGCDSPIEPRMKTKRINKLLSCKLKADYKRKSLKVSAKKQANKTNFKSCSSDKVVCSDLFKHSNHDSSDDAQEYKISKQDSQKTTSDIKNSSDNLSFSSTESVERKLVVDEPSTSNSYQPTLKFVNNDLGAMENRIHDERRNKQIILPTIEDDNFTTKCNICQKMFANKSTLKRHRQLHEGVRFPCPACNRNFSRQDYLKIHMRKCKHALALTSSISSNVQESSETICKEIKNCFPDMNTFNENQCTYELIRNEKCEISHLNNDKRHLISPGQSGIEQ